jgi:hypothetical protein
MNDKDYGLDEADEKDVIAFVIKNKQKYKWIKDNFKKASITQDIVKTIEQKIEEWYSEAPNRAG